MKVVVDSNVLRRPGFMEYAKMVSDQESKHLYQFKANSRKIEQLK